jgi:hypothetical protein
MATTKKHTKKTGDSSKKGTVSNGDFQKSKSCRNKYDHNFQVQAAI